MLSSVETQTKVVAQTAEKYEKQKFDTTKKLLQKELKTLESEWTMFEIKKKTLDEKVEVPLAVGSDLKAQLVSDYSSDVRSFRRSHRGRSLFN